MSTIDNVTTELASSLVEDLGLFPRNVIDDVHVRALAEAIRAGDVLPPIVVDRRTRIVVDGIHRRRAAIRAHGAGATVVVQWREYPDRESMLVDAARLNARHGKRLTPNEIVRVVTLADEMNISRTVIADALGLRVETLESLVRRIVAYDTGHRPTPVKPALRHLAGEQLTTEQVMANKQLGGYQARYLVRQLLVLLESNGIDWNDAVLVERLRTLWRLLSAHFADSADSAGTDRPDGAVVLSDTKS